MCSRFIRLVLFFFFFFIKTSQRKAYIKFVKDIKKIGFYMLQESVYIKMCLDSQASNSTINKVKDLAPSEGSIMILMVTEKEFSEMKVVCGESISDVITTSDRVVVL